MEQFVKDFMEARKKQKGGKMMSVYAQIGRFERLYKKLAEIFPGVGHMKKSERFDFMMFVLEGFIKREYGNYKTFNEIHVEAGKVIDSSNDDI